MIQSGMMFGGEGPVMQGTWYDPRTGDAFTVRDSFFEDNQYVVTTTDGRYMYYNQLQNYVQTDMKLEDLKRMKAESQKPVNEPLPAEVANLIADDDDPYGSLLLPEDACLTVPMSPPAPKLGNIYKSNLNDGLSNRLTAVPELPAGETFSSMNEAIIDKALRNASAPHFDIGIVWPNFPEKEIEMLKDIMDIHEDEIIEWYLGTVPFGDLVEAVKAAIKDRITTYKEKRWSILEDLSLRGNRMDTPDMPRLPRLEPFDEYIPNGDIVLPEVSFGDSSFEEPCALADESKAKPKPVKPKKTTTKKKKDAK